MGQVLGLSRKDVRGRRVKTEPQGSETWQPKGGCATHSVPAPDSSWNQCPAPHSRDLHFHDSEGRTCKAIKKQDSYRLNAKKEIEQGSGRKNNWESSSVEYCRTLSPDELWYSALRNLREGKITVEATWVCEIPFIHDVVQKEN